MESSANVFLSSGLSPLARGNHLLGLCERFDVGSIPARTGEPPMPMPMTNTSGVYPRSHGGTEALLADPEWQAGLSPLTRGNPETVISMVHLLGSIPARTGEPRTPIQPHGRQRVYPRSHGGTFHVR